MPMPRLDTLDALVILHHVTGREYREKRDIL